MNEEIETKMMNVTIDTNTGENKILGEEAQAESKEDIFNKVVESINSDESEDDPLTQEDISKYTSEDMKYSSKLSSMASKSDLSEESMVKLLELVNRRIKKEDFNIYKELPDEIKEMVDDYISNNPEFMATDRAIINRIKKTVSESLIDEFISNIKFDKTKNDFATEMAKLYSDANKDISEAALELVETRNAEYRKAAEKIEDEEKKKKLLSIIDTIDEARALTELKEYAKKAKIKHIQLEKPNKVYVDFLNKYKDSSLNIYNISLARNAISRYLDNPEDADIFCVSFCNQVRLYDIKNVLHHAYMYYVLYFAATIDGDKSGKFIENVKEVVANAKSRNNL